MLPPEKYVKSLVLAAIESCCADSIKMVLKKHEVIKP